MLSQLETVYVLEGLGSLPDAGGEEQAGSHSFEDQVCSRSLHREGCHMSRACYRSLITFGPHDIGESSIAAHAMLGDVYS